MRCTRTRSTPGRSSCSTTPRGCSMPRSGSRRRSAPPGRRRTSTPRSASSPWNGIFYPGGPDDEHSGSPSRARPHPPGSVGAPAMRPAEPGPLRGVPARCGHGRDGPGADAPDRRVVPGASVPGLAPDGADAVAGWRAGEPQAGAAPDAANGDRGARSEAEHLAAGAGAQDLPLPAAGLDDRAAQPRAADITYIPIGQGFLYLVAIIDWASRAVLSWRLSNTMD